MDPYDGQNPSTSSTNDDSIKVSSRKKCFSIIPITIEPIFFFIFFSSSFTDSIITNLIETRICTVSLNYPKSNCSGTLTTEISQEVQPIATRILMAKSIIDTFFPAILSFFIGPWSDSNGRKPFLLFCIAGFAVQHVLWACFAYFQAIPAVFFLFVAIPVAFSGGLVALFISCFCYIGDVTLAKNRGFRMACADSALMLGVVLGYLAISRVYKAAGEYGTVVPFLVASGAELITFLYTLFCLPESVVISQGTERKSLFETSHVKEMFRTILTQRPRHGRSVILLIIAACSIAITVMKGELSVRYMSLQERFSWTLGQYNNFAAFTSLVGATATFFGMWILNKLLNMPDMVVALLSCSLAIASQIFVALSRSSWWFIIAINVGCFGALIGPVARSELSKIVPTKDLGKAFGFMTTMESVIPLIVSPIYPLVYSNILSTAPMAVYFLSVGFSLVIITLVIIVLGLQYTYGKPYYILLENESDTSENDVEDSASIFKKD